METMLGFVLLSSTPSIRDKIDIVIPRPARVIHKLEDGVTKARELFTESSLSVKIYTMKAYFKLFFFFEKNMIYKNRRYV